MKNIVITGVTSGLGEKLAELFKNNNSNVVGISRGEGEYNTYYCDISDEERVKECFEKIKKNGTTIDILINNAGYGISGVSELLSSEEVHKQFNVNFFGSFYAIKYALPLMKKGSKIINISSACALFPLPFRAMYCASKSALHSLSLSLYMELKEYGISVTSICPGDIKTNFTKNRIKNFDTNDRYGDKIIVATKKIDSRENKRMDINYVAKKIFKICNKKKLKPMYIVGRKYKLLYLAKRVTSNATFTNSTEKVFSGKLSKKD